MRPDPLPAPAPVRPRSPLPPAGRALRRARRAVLARRRPLAALCAGLAVLLAVRAAQAPPVPTSPVVVARADLPGGTVLTGADLSVADLPSGAVPAGATGAPQLLLGRTLAAPVRRGEPLTDVRVVAPALLDGYPGLVAAPVRVADAGSVGMLRVGDRIDVLAATPAADAAGQGAAVVASAVPVVALPRPGRTGDGLTQGGLVVVAVPPDRALALAAAAAARVLSVVLVG